VCEAGRLTQNPCSLGDVLGEDERGTQSHFTQRVVAYIGSAIVAG
jgi:hypothetical protein